MDDTTRPRPRSHSGIGQRLGHELRRYIAISAYLYVCCSTLLLYKAAILWGHDIEYVPYGLAIGKALILGKFVLIGQEVRIGASLKGRTLAHAIVYKSLLFLLLLVGLSAVEEAIMGFVRHGTIRGSLADLAGGTLAQTVAASLLLLLVLIPYFAYRELDAALGPGTLLRLLRRRGAADQVPCPAPRLPSPSSRRT